MRGRGINDRRRLWQAARRIPTGTVTHPPIRSPLRLWLSAFALAIVLATQWLALVHSASAHGRWHALPQAQLTGTPAAQPSAAAPLQAAQSVALAHDDGTVWCLLLDHCLQAGHVAFDAPAVADGAIGALDLPRLNTVAPAARWARYLARAPPVLVPLHQA